MKTTGADPKHPKTIEESVAELISRGYETRENLREILPLAWHKPTAAMVDNYIRHHTSEVELLRKLMEIALEGWDNGDAPSIAANYISEFPGELLREFESELRKLSREPWPYISNSAQRALLKIRRG